MDASAGEKDKVVNAVPGHDKGYDNSSLLRKLNPSRYPGVIGCSESLLDKMKLVPGLSPQRPSDVKKLQHNAGFLVLNLYHVYQQDPSRWVSYSRRKTAYTDKGSKYKEKFKLSYDYTTRVIKFLLDNEYVEHSSSYYKEDEPWFNRQSRIRSTPKLIDLIIQHRESEGMEEPWDEDDGDYEGEETIVMKGEKPRNKELKRKICKTPDNKRVRSLRKNIQVINSIMDRTEITLPLTPEELQRLNENLRKDGSASIDFTKKRLHRVFLDRRLDRGGRFYGAWYQGIPKEYRERILINGSPVCEPDFSGYHPRMLYAMVGQPFMSDPYQLEGYPDTPEMRNFLKPLLLMIVNANDEQGAIKGMREKIRKEAKKAERWGRKIVPLGVEIRTDAQYREVMSKLMFLHQPIEKFFYSGMGSYLQYLDSQIAEAVMLNFAHHLNVAVLPIHDSFIVDFRLVEVLEEFMTQLAENHLQQLFSQQAFPVKSGTGGIQRNLDLAGSLAASGMPDQFKDSFMEALKDHPQNEEWLRTLEKEAKERVDLTRGS